MVYLLVFNDLFNTEERSLGLGKINITIIRRNNDDSKSIDIEKKIDSAQGL